MRTALVMSLVLAVVAVVFALQNPQMVRVNLLFVETQGSAALVLILTFALGVAVGILSTLPSRIRDKRELKRLKKSRSTGTSSSGMSSSSASSPTSSSPTSSPSSSTEGNSSTVGNA
jgi:putative membrane protein